MGVVGLLVAAAIVVVANENGSFDDRRIREMRKRLRELGDSRLPAEALHWLNGQVDALKDDIEELVRRYR